MTLPRVYALNEYWHAHPPVHLMIAAYLGIKPDAPSRLGGKKGADMADLISNFSEAGFAVEKQSKVESEK